MSHPTPRGPLKCHGSARITIIYLYFFLLFQHLNCVLSLLTDSFCVCCTTHIISQYYHFMTSVENFSLCFMHWLDVHDVILLAKYQINVLLWKPSTSQKLIMNSLLPTADRTWKKIEETFMFRILKLSKIISRDICRGVAKTQATWAGPMH